MTAIRLGSERLTAVSKGFADLISATCGGELAIPNGLLNGSVFGNDIRSLSAHHPGGWGNNRGAVQFGSPPRTPPLTAPRTFQLPGLPQFGRHTGKPQLLGFGSFVSVRTFFGSIYRCEKRLGARRSAHFARQRLTEGNIFAIDRNGGVIVLLDLGAIHCDSSKQAFGARVAQGLRGHLPVGACRLMPSNRPGCRGGFAAEFKLAREQPLHTFVIHEQHDEIDRLSASLEAKIAAADRNECRRTP